jgi:ParB-like chromosome segregation protein Spo0J
VRHETLPIHLLDSHEDNYKSHPDEQVARLQESLKRFGQVRSIVVKARNDGRYSILAGHGVTEAARLNGATEMRCDIVPDYWDEVQCAGYLIADNLTSEGGEDDPIALAQLLEGQASAGYLLETVGASDDALARLLEAANGALALGDDPDVPMAEDPGREYESQFAIAVMCDSEVEQREVYARLVGLGYQCKVLVV